MSSANIDGSSHVGQAKTNITEKDIAKCKGSNQSFTAIFYNQAKSLYRNGEFVNDKSIQKFLLQDNNIQHYKEVFEGVKPGVHAQIADFPHTGKEITDPVLREDLRKIFLNSAVYLIDNKGMQNLNDFRLTLRNYNQPQIQKNSSFKEQKPVQVANPTITFTKTVIDVDTLNLINIQKLAPHRIRNFDDIQLKKLVVGQLTYFNTEQIQALGPKICHLEPGQLNALLQEPGFIKKLSPDQIKEILKQSIAPNALNGKINDNLIKILKVLSLEKINVGSLSTKILNDPLLLKSGFFEKLNSEQRQVLEKKNLTPEVLKKLTGKGIVDETNETIEPGRNNESPPNLKKIQDLDLLGIQELNFSQINTFTKEELNALVYGQLIYFSDKQIQAMGENIIQLNPGELRLFLEEPGSQEKFSSHQMDLMKALNLIPSDKKWAESLGKNLLELPQEALLTFLHSKPGKIIHPDFGPAVDDSPVEKLTYSQIKQVLDTQNDESSHPLKGKINAEVMYELGRREEFLRVVQEQT